MRESGVKEFSNPHKKSMYFGFFILSWVVRRSVTNSRKFIFQYLRGRGEFVAFSVKIQKKTFTLKISPKQEFFMYVGARDKQFLGPGPSRFLKLH